MSAAERSAAAKKGWETRRKNGFKAKGKESMADRAARGGPSVGDQMAAGPMEPMRNPKKLKRVGKKPAVKKAPSSAKRSAAVSVAAARKKKDSGGSTKKSALSAKDQNLPYEVKVKKLRTIATRAQAKADWLSGKKGKDGNQLPAEFVDQTRAVEYQAKAKAVADELLALAQENNDPRVAHIGKPVGKKPATKKR